MFRVVLVAVHLAQVFAADAGCDLQCRTVRALGRFSADTIEISDGVRLVRNGGNGTGRGTTAPESVVSAVRQFAGRYDLHVKLKELLPPREDVVHGLRTALTYLSDNADGRASGGGKKGGAMLMMATMMGGTMAALGFGALGMLAMKALTVSAMALMLSVIMGLKKLMSKHEHESGHIVSYVPVHHAVRRRRHISPRFG